MFNKDRWDEILEALGSNVLRTLLTAIGVAWGIAVLIILIALTNGLRNGVQAGFSDFATNSIFVWSQGTSMAYKGLPKGRSFNFKTQDVSLLKDRFPELKYVSPRNQLGSFRGSNNVIRNEKAGAFNIYGDYPEFIEQQPMDIMEGRFISYSDIQDKRKVAVIGRDVVNGLYDKYEEVIGSYVKINGINFLVVGTFKSSNSNGDDEEDANTIYIPFTTFSQAFNRADNVGWMAITAYDNTNITDLKPKIMATIREQRSVHPDDERAIGNFDLAQEFNRISGLFSVLSLVGFVVGILVLFSGGVGITNIMLIVIKERNKEIGIRRALGASPWSIRVQIFQESLFLTLISGLAGIAFATGIIWILNTVLDSVGPVDNFVNPSVEIGLIVLALMVLVLTGIFAGLLPAFKATKMKPVDALRLD
jgi:putative ABC transport system permease protein